VALMETVAPPVVAVIVTCDPGEWFEDTLRSFAAQDYPELSVLVLDAGSRRDPTPRVAAVLPGAFVRQLGVNEGFGSSANHVIGMVEGASHLLFCHDDVALDPDAVHILVEESFRSNAGVVSPKFVSWDDASRLLHVGMAVDKGGAVVDRVQPGEIDHGQHDAVRDVFLAPGGCTLVRADLFAELGGFDPDIFVMGEDLDLCWRAQVSGARVVVAPGARVRHREMLASGQRGLPDAIAPGAGPASSLVGAGAAAIAAADGDAPAPGAAPGPAPARAALHRGGAPVTLQALQRRHELHAVLKAYGPFHLVRVLPQLIALSLAEAVIAFVAGHRERSAAVHQAWRWNVAHRQRLRRERGAVQAHRRLDDAEVRRLQLRGSARLNGYVRRAVTQGLHVANRGETSVALREVPEPGTDVAPAPGPATSTRAVVWLAVALVLVFGTRQLLGPGFPFVGQLLPMPSAGTLLHRFLSGWQPTGVGTTDPTTPATGLLGLGGTLLFGGVGLLQKVLVFGCVPLGALGMSRLARPLGTPWARITATVIYVAVPVPYDALASGRVDVLAVYGACPWILNRLARASRAAPHDQPAGPAVPDASRSGERASAPWRRSVPGHGLALGLVLALLTSVAPAGIAVTLVIAVGLCLGLVMTGGRRGLRSAGRVGAVTGSAVVVAVVLLMPWSFAVLGGPGRWQTLTGLAVAPSSGVGWGHLLRFAAGPIGDTPLTWAFLAAAALPIAIGRRWRLAWAGTAWSVAVVAWVIAWAGERGWLGSFALSAQTLLVPAAAAIALCVGLGVAAFELDLPGYRFGWRQGAAVLAAVAGAVGMLPVLGASVNGRWDLPLTGYGQAVSWMAAQQSQGAFRVLWLGDPRVLPGTGWQLAPGLSYVVSENGLPDTTALWPGSAPGPAAAIGRAVTLAEHHGTVRLGRILAPYAVRYVVVVQTLAPSIPGFQSPSGYEAPADLAPALLGQVDLHELISQGGFEVFVDAAALPVRAVRLVGAPAPAPTVAGPSPGLQGWRPALRGSPGATQVSGRVPAGTVLDAVAPAGRWHLVGAGGHSARATTAFGFAATFSVRRAGPVTVAFAESADHGLVIAGEIVLWVLVVGALAGRRRTVEWWWGRLVRRRRRVAPPTAQRHRPPAPDEDEAHPARSGPSVARSGGSSR